MAYRLYFFLLPFLPSFCSFKKENVLPKRKPKEICYKVSWDYKVVSQEYKVVSRDYKVVSRDYNVVSRDYKVVSRDYKVMIYDLPQIRKY